MSTIELGNPPAQPERIEPGALGYTPERAEAVRLTAPDGRVVKERHPERPTHKFFMGERRTA